MYTSILGNKQSTINSYMYFFFLFPFSHTKKVWGDTNSVVIYLQQIRASINFFSSVDWCLTFGDPTENRLPFKARKNK